MYFINRKMKSRNVRSFNVVAVYAHIRVDSMPAMIAFLIVPSMKVARIEKM